MFRTVASVCWNMRFNAYLNFDETKILFTENIIYNYIELMKELSDKMDSLIEMMAQQPQKAEPQQQSGGIMQSLQSLIGSP